MAIERTFGSLPGAKQAVLWGDPKTFAYGLLRRLPAGAALPSPVKKLLKAL